MQAIGEICDDGWEGKIPGLHVGFYIGGSVDAYDSVQGLAAKRFSRKKKLLLVDSLHRAIALAEDVFSRKGGEPFDVVKADSIVNRNNLYLTDAECRKRIDSQIRPGA